MERRDVQLVRRGYDAFAARDFDTLSELLDPDVRWHGADEEDPQGGCRNRGEVFAFIRNVLAERGGIDVLDVLEIREAGEYVLVVLQADREDEDGNPTPHGELVTVVDDKIVAMIVYESVDEAVEAAQGG